MGLQINCEILKQAESKQNTPDEGKLSASTFGEVQAKAMELLVPQEQRAGSKMTNTQPLHGEWLTEWLSGWVSVCVAGCLSVDG